MKRKDNEEYRESQIATISIFGFPFYKIFFILFETAVYTITLYLYVAGYLKRSSDMPKLI